MQLDQTDSQASGISYGLCGLSLEVNRLCMHEIGTSIATVMLFVEPRGAELQSQFIDTHKTVHALLCTTLQ